MRDIEILAPAGSTESLYAALSLGADAVYTGTTRFGARAFADNPSVGELEEAIAYAHIRQKKIYLTVNTLLTDRELEEELFPLIEPLYEAGLDACIVQDVGVLSFLHDNFPKMDLHASTQMTLFSGDEAEIFAPYGVTRYVPARELTIEEIKRAKQETGMEIEVFVHGALCYCYSGQCLMSEEIGGRSGNRGMCAQPCRLSYRTSLGNGYVLNTKDVCTLFKIPELVDAGIDSFKIEGRMKKKEYSAYMAYLYRKYVSFYQEEGREAYRKLVEDKESRLWCDYKRSQDIFNRGGFSESFLFEKEKRNMICLNKNGHYGTLVGTVKSVSGGKVSFEAKEAIRYQDVLEFRLKDGTSAYEYTVKNEAAKGDLVTANIKKGSRLYPGQNVFRRKNAFLLQEIERQIEEKQKKYPLSGRFIGQIGEPVILSVSGGGVEVTSKGDILQKAQKSPVSVEDIQKNLSALGSTPYCFEDLSVTLEKGAFLAVGSIKKLRRQALSEWERQMAHRRIRVVEKTETKPEAKGEIPPAADRDWIAVSSSEQLRAALSAVRGNPGYLIRLSDITAEEWETVVSMLKGNCYALEYPAVLRGKGRQVFENKWNRYGSVFFANKPVAVFVNSYRGLLYAKHDFPDSIHYAEKNLYRKNERAKKVWRDLSLYPAPEVTYGRKAVMQTEGCICATMERCQKGIKRVSLTGPKGDAFEAIMHCDYCFNTIYTKDPVIEKSGNKVRLNLTWETADEVRRLVREWKL